jgi:hypothetical protein
MQWGPGSGLRLGTAYLRQQQADFGQLFRNLFHYFLPLFHQHTAVVFLGACTGYLRETSKTTGRARSIENPP